MRASFPIVALCLAFGILTRIHPAYGQNVPRGEPVLGYWYMGTMSGEDHNLILNADGTLSLQNGGCFHQDPAIKSSWRRKGNRITFDNAALRSQLGSALRIVRYRGYVLLVPQRRDAESTRLSGYSLRYCFWQNSMQAGGLRIPPLAYQAEWSGTLSAGERHDYHRRTVRR